MWIAFIDESGDYNYSQKALDESPYYALTALIIHDDYLFWLEKGVREIWRKYFSEEFQRLNLFQGTSPKFKEIHMSEIVHGKKNYEGISSSARSGFINELFKFLRDFPSVRVISVLMNKKRILENTAGYSLNSLSQREIKLVGRRTMVKTYQLLLERLVKFLSKQISTRGSPEYMLLIVDSNPKMDPKVKEDVIREVERGIYTSKIPESKYVILPPLFVESYRMIGIQLADVLSYVIVRRIKEERLGVKPKKGFNFKLYYSIVGGING
ncbi:hypothetical protein PNA2_0679 [Pyrococcus sp. NA2]|uniref:DUF3800 domain-containing protein n=1 Tax=Pyrococcus sp. (strain NA2) TaxID=342949 RepID=UPI000209AD37|nr:DUF3800 domain-containing protein [Pyrococcus sp. NA2]AEC51595.1 hypothetical protein PNA2_0679 [Pyrococcus sp. NA2]